MLEKLFGEKYFIGGVLNSILTDRMIVAILFLISEKQLLNE